MGAQTMNDRAYDRQEFKVWLEQQKENLKDHSIDEIAIIAISCGFNRSDVNQWKVSMTFKAS